MTHTSPSPVIVNQIDEDFGRALAEHPAKPRIIDDLEPERPWELPAEAEILVTRSHPSWRQAPQSGVAPEGLRWIQTYSAGVEPYPRWLTDGRLFSCGRGLTAPQIAEYALAAILRAEKRLDEIRATGLASWTKHMLGGVEGKTLGLIGYGAIGQETAKRARAFGMEILACRRGPWTATDPGVTACASPAEVVSRSDYLLLATPLTPATERLVDASLLAQAKPGLHLINISRGGVLDQEALIEALDAGRLSGATLDVTTPEPLPEGHPLWTHPKVLLTPHVSYSGGPEMARFLAKVVANLDAYLAGAPLSDLVDPARGY